MISFGSQFIYRVYLYYVCIQLILIIYPNVISTHPVTFHNYHNSTSVNDTHNLHPHHHLHQHNHSQPHHSTTKLPRVIICVMMLSEHLYTDEWIQYNIFLGFDLIHIYDNTWNGSDYLRSLPKRYGHYVRVDHHPGGGAQLDTYRRCLLRYRSKPIWAAFIDNDEFIVLRNHTSIKHLIRDVKPNGGALYLNWIIFGTNGHQHYSHELVLKRFTERSPIVSEWGKSISFLPDVDEIRPHWPLQISGKKLQ